MRSYWYKCEPLRTCCAFFFIAVLFARVGFCQGALRILVRGQEMVFESLTMKNDLPCIASDDKSLARLAALLGGEKAWLPSSQLKSVFSVRDLAKLYKANANFDPDRNVWYLDPWVNGISLKAGENKITVNVQSTAPIQPNITRLENPPRLVLDFPYSALAENVSPPLIESGGLVDRIEVAQFQSKPNIVRVVLHLTQTNIQWATGVDEETKAFSVAVSPMLTPVFQGNTTSEKEGGGSPSVLGGVELKPVTQGTEEKLIAELKLSAPTAYAWRKLQAPDNRTYIDFSSCQVGMSKSIDMNNPYFEDIRVAQFQRTPVPIVRVVFQLRKPFHLEVQSSGEGVEVTVSSRAEGADEVLSGGGTTGFSSKVAALQGGGIHPRAPTHPNGITLVLDPGHGGSDPGARGRTLVEKEVTLDIAERLREKLAGSGFAVLMTRMGDHDVLGYHGSAKAELQARVDVARRGKARMFISLHINSSDYFWPRGLQTHWYKSMDLPLANMIQKRLREVSAFVDRGVVRDRFYVLHHTSIPAALVEMGFISNSGDEAKLASSAVREQLAEAICQGIAEYAGVRRNAHL